MPDKESEKIEIRSDEVQDILGMIPSWIVRWGTVVIFMTVIIILGGSWFFSYPDILRADIIVTTENPPVTLEARTDGQIDLFVENNQYVKTNIHLAMIKNPAAYADVYNLLFEIELLKTIIPDFEKEEFEELDKNYQLGDIQPAYSEFSESYRDYYNFLVMDYFSQMNRSKVIEIQRQQLKLKELDGLKSILQKQLDIENTQFKRASNLYSDSVYTELEYEEAQQKLNEIQMQFGQSQLDITETEILIYELQQDTLNLRLTEEQEKQQRQNNLRVTFENLIAEIGNWEQKHVLIAPIEGRVTFLRVWAENQNVNTGEKVLTVIPDEPGEIIGKIDLPMEGSGKVEKGDRVNIQFADFPHLQYGMVEGFIRTKSQVPYDEKYLVEVELPDSLVTYYGNVIPFNQEMFGRAEIITDERRLLERIFSPIRSVINEQRQTR